MRLLLVEDHDDTRRLLARLLRAYGFDVLAAADGFAALDALAGFEPAAVLTDLVMPGMDGIELVRRVRGLSALSAVPVVVMSASPSAAAAREAILAGAGAFVAKPVDVLWLVATLGPPSPPGEW